MYAVEMLAFSNILVSIRHVLSDVVSDKTPVSAAVAFFMLLSPICHQRHSLLALHVSTVIYQKFVNLAKHKFTT